MRLIYVVPFYPHPLDDGGRIRIWHTLRVLGERNEVHLVVQDVEPPTESLTEVRAQVASVTFVPPAHAKGRWGKSLDGRLGSFVDMCTYPPSFLRRYRSHCLLRQVQRIVDEGTTPDWIICDTQLCGQVALFSDLPPVPRALCLYDLYDEYYQRKLEHVPFGRFRQKVRLDRLKTGHYEKRIMRRFDLLAVVSEADQVSVRARLPHTFPVIVPGGVDLEYFRPQHRAPSAHADAPSILFVGNLAYEPNADGVRYFLDEIWPHIHSQRPQATFVVAGKQPPPWLVARADGDATLVVTGPVDDLRPLYARARVAVVPLRLGAGTKLKLLEALAMGVAVVTTPEGCAGIDVRQSEHVLVGESTEGFIQALLLALDDSLLRDRLVQAGRKLVELRYGWTAIMKNYEETLQQFGGPHH